MFIKNEKIVTETIDNLRSFNCFLSHNNYFNFLFKELISSNTEKPIFNLLKNTLKNVISCTCFKLDKELIIDILNKFIEYFSIGEKELDYKYIDCLSQVAFHYTLKYENINVIIEMKFINKLINLLENNSNIDGIIIDKILLLIINISEFYNGSKIIFENINIDNLINLLDNYNIDDDEITTNYIKDDIIKIFNNFSKNEELKIKLRQYPNIKKSINKFILNTLNFEYKNMAQNILIDLDLYDFEDVKIENKNLKKINNCLNSFKKISLSEIDKNSACSICMCNFDENDEGKIIKMNNCQHVFHIDCISESIRKSCDTCPNCRVKIID